MSKDTVNTCCFHVCCIPAPLVREAPALPPQITRPHLDLKVIALESLALLYTSSVHV